MNNGIVEVYRGFEIWDRVSYTGLSYLSGYIVPPPIDAAGPTIEGIRMAIDRYIASGVYVEPGVVVQPEPADEDEWKLMDQWGGTIQAPPPTLHVNVVITVRQNLAYFQVNVADTATLTPISGAQVSINGGGGFTNANGELSVNIPVGEFQQDTALVVVNVAGYEQFTATVPVPVVVPYTPEQQLHIGGRVAEVPENMLHLIPSETTDIFKVEMAVPKLGLGFNIPSDESIRFEVQRSLVAEGYGADAEVVKVFHQKVAGYPWLSLNDRYFYWVCVRSPLAIITTIGIMTLLKIAFFALLAAVVVRIIAVPIIIAKIAADVVMDGNETIENLKEQNAEIIRNITNSDLSDEQKQAMIAMLLDAEAKETQSITDAQEKVAEGIGKDWTDNMVGMITGIMPLVLVFLLIGMIPRGKKG